MYVTRSKDRDVVSFGLFAYKYQRIIAVKIKKYKDMNALKAEELIL